MPYFLQGQPFIKGISRSSMIIESLVTVLGSNHYKQCVYKQTAYSSAMQNLELN